MILYMLDFICGIGFYRIFSFLGQKMRTSHVGVLSRGRVRNGVGFQNEI